MLFARKEKKEGSMASGFSQGRCTLRAVYTMEFYFAIMNNEILLFSGKWLELENIILSEISQVQKAGGCMFSLICGI
jgi:hypothetical protein